MEFKKCSRCGNFYVSEGNVCPKCSPKDNLEFSTFKSYINENGLQDSLDTISGRTGISVRNLNRFMQYANSNGQVLENGEQLGSLGNSTNKQEENNGITFLI